jgi:hypothetical protein
MNVCLNGIQWQGLLQGWNLPAGRLDILMKLKTNAGYCLCGPKRCQALYG